MYTAMKKDLTFSAIFHLEVQRKDNIHALATFFTVEFTKCHVLTGISTAPEVPLTLWEQTLFFLENSLNVEKNDKIIGKFSMCPNKDNRVATDFIIDVKFKNNVHDVIESNNYYMT